MNPFDLRPRGVSRGYVASRLLVRERAAEDGSGAAAPEIVGHAAVFNQETVLYDGRYWRQTERIRPGAFARALRENQDVRALLNHDPNFVLGRTVSGTLALSEDETGLLSVVRPPDTQSVRDLVLTPIRRGDMSGMSFAFVPRESDKVVTTETPDGEVYDLGGEIITVRYVGDKMIQHHELVDVDLYDVSPVTYPAYSGTDVALRSRPDLSDLIRRMDVPHARPVKTPRLDSLRARLSTRGASPRGR